MKTIQELNKQHIPVVIIDSNLNKLDDIMLFPEKVEKAKQTIARIGLPKKKYNQQHANGKYR